MAMQLLSLGYMGFAGQDLAAWRRFSARLLGAQSCERTVEGVGPVLGLRLDGMCHRFILVASDAMPKAWFGFDVGGAAGLERVRTVLREHGHEAVEATPQELALRRVEDMVWTQDPDGYRLEFYWGLAQDPAPFTPDRPMGGFRTEGVGVGHVVLCVGQLERAEAYYREVLGFRVSDYVNEPYRRAFLRINGRHHSVALAERPGGGIAHIMVEVKEFDDVGRAYDVALGEYQGRIYSTLGRHSNDHMTSFYVNTPAGIPLEYGWGGRTVDEATWEVRSLFGPSLWGHDRIGADPAAREAANRQREYAFREGLRAPLAPEVTRRA
jgi:2,3-dihydroxybiphenyl 1,2-dioxygenase